MPRNDISSRFTSWVGRHHRAFSLFELVIVLAIVSALAGIAVPRYAHSLAGYRANAAANRVVADLTYARTRAESRMTTQQVTFDAANNAYELVAVAGLDNPAGAYIVTLTDEPYDAELITVTLGGDEIVVFDGYGIPDSGGSVVVQSGDVQRTVVLDAATGEATVQ